MRAKQLTMAFVVGAALAGSLALASAKEMAGDVQGDRLMDVTIDSRDGKALAARDDRPDRDDEKEHEG